jgi:hypothetical protein
MGCRMNKLFLQGLKPSLMCLETARLKPRPFKELFMKHALVIVCLCLPALGQATYSGSVADSGSAMYGTPGQGILAGENAYCPPGPSGELTEGTPTWGASDGPAALSSQCMNTAMSSTPSGAHIGGGGAATFVPATGTTLANVLASTSGSLVNLDGTTTGTPSYYLQCGDAIQLTAGSSYGGSFTFPPLACDGGHWIMVKSSGVANSNFPGEGSRATPCLAGISNDATNGYNAPGYPPYSCPSYPTVLSAQLKSITVNQPAMQFTTNSNHYRFIGIEVTKQTDVRVGSLIVMADDAVTQGANHIIFDRSVIHGQPWTLTSGANSETQGGIKAKNSQWVALINSWDYDTYCVSACVDSQGFSGGEGLYQDGPFKLYNNLIASAAETIMFGGSGVGPGTPSTNGLEFRTNVSMKPLAWMLPIETCYLYPNNPDTKNLGEFKDGTFLLFEGNYFENSWQGCQSDQSGETLILDPVSQAAENTDLVSFDGSDMVVTNTTGPFYITYLTAGRTSYPDDPTYCPVAGCHFNVGTTHYKFCASDGSNGCDQSGMTLHTCTTTNCTARLVSPGTIPGAGTVSAKWFVPGLSPDAISNNAVVRYNEFYNAMNGMSIITKVSDGGDEAQSLDHVSIHDNYFHGLSTEMENSPAATSSVSGFEMGNGQVTHVLHDITVAHNTVAVETNGDSFGAFGQQVDHQDNKYLSGFNLHDNVTLGGWHVDRSAGTMMSGGLANNFQTDACQPYYPNANACGSGTQACTDGNGNVINTGATGIAFGSFGTLSDFIITKNGTIPAHTCTAGSSANDCGGNSFTLNTTLAVGDAFTVRDVTSCNWTFVGNIIGEWDPGQGTTEDPYPNGTDAYSGFSTPNAANANNCGKPGGGLGGTQACILGQSAFPAIFTSWDPRSGDLSIASPTYKGTATDASSRGATGKDPGADLTTIGNLLAGVHAAEVYPAISISSGTLTAATHNVAYQSALTTPAYGVTGGGASPFKMWWQETDTSRCAGNCGTTPLALVQAGIMIARDGTVNGPFPLLLVSRTSGTSTLTPKPQMVSEMGSSPIVPWQIGQTIVLSGFVNGSGSQANDASFNGTYVISSATTNNFSCAQAGADIAQHGPYHAQSSNAILYGVVTFAPITPGTYQFWMGAKDGAFQKAWAQISVTVN